MADRDLVEVIEQGDYLFVTNDRFDILTRHGGMAVHNGLIVIVLNVRRAKQVRPFNRVLDRLGTLPDLISQVMEIEAEGGIVVRPPASAD